MSKVQKHIATLVVLAAISVTLALTGKKGNVASFNRSLFQIEDTADVQQIAVVKNEHEFSISRVQGDWRLNETLEVDKALINIFNAIISQVQIVRPVSQLNIEEIKSDIERNGQLVKIQVKNEWREFYTGGNATKTKAYFADKELEEIYFVAIPGYQHYLTGIFELTSNQWRDRTLFNSSWRTLQNLKVEYTNPEEQPLDIYFENRSLKVAGVQRADTARLIEFANQFSNFQLNDYLDEGQFPRYDSLHQTQPIAKVTVKDIDKRFDRQLKVFPLIDGERFYLFSDDANQMIVVDKSRTEAILQSPSFFEKE